MSVWDLIAGLRGVLGKADERAECDGCDGSFVWRDLHPCSGDFWLCDDCLRKYMADPSPGLPTRGEGTI